jgi:hypothetical protein
LGIFFPDGGSLAHMRTAGAWAVVGLVLFIEAAAACSSDEPAASPPALDAGPVDDDSGGTAGPDAAEGGGTAEPGAPKRGTRLAPQFRETADGLSELLMMVDTGLGNTQCYPSRAEDGAVRCLPSEAAYAPIAAAAYADATCTTPVVDVTAGCVKPAFAIRPSEGGGCDVTTTVFDVGAQHTTQIYSKTDATTCTPLASDAKKAYYVLGAKRAPTDFVKLTARTLSIAGGVGVTMQDGEDGSSAPQYQLIDVARAHACHEGTTLDGKTRCIPAGNANAGFAFVDNACAKPAALASTYDCDPLVKAIFASAAPASDGREQLYELGAKQATKDFYRQVDMTCDGPITGSENVYELGAEIPATSFPELAITSKGGTRIVAKRWSAAGVTLFPTIGLHDNMLDLRCSPMTASDGKERCLPQGQVVFYSDDQCAVPITFTSQVPAPKYAIGFGAGCPRPFRVHPVGAAIEPKPTSIWENFNGTCMETPGGAGGATVYALGAEAPPSTFVELTRVVR